MIDRALLEWPLVVATIVKFGTAAFVVLSWRDEPDEVSVNAAHLLPIWRVLSVVTVVVSPLVLLDMTEEMAGVSWKGALPLVPEVLTETHAGSVWEWALPVTLLFLLGAFMPLRQSIRARMLFVLSGALLFLQALLSHAIDKGWFAVALQFAHELAAGLWLGALLSLWITSRHGDASDGWVERATQRVSRIAFWSVVAIVLAGARGQRFRPSRSVVAQCRIGISGLGFPRVGIGRSSRQHASSSRWGTWRPCDDGDVYRRSAESISKKARRRISSEDTRKMVSRRCILVLATLAALANAAIVSSCNSGRPTAGAYPAANGNSPLVSGLTGATPARPVYRDETA
jgi:hypothetical protein